MIACLNFALAVADLWGMEGADEVKKLAGSTPLALMSLGGDAGKVGPMSTNAS